VLFVVWSICIYDLVDCRADVRPGLRVNWQRVAQSPAFSNSAVLPSASLARPRSNRQVMKENRSDKTRRRKRDIQPIIRRLAQTF
jgi:hypothetical protein